MRRVHTLVQSRATGTVVRSVLLLLLLTTAVSQVQGQGVPIPRVSVGVDSSSNPKDVAVTLQILFLLTILSLAPAILMLCTSFTRIVIVLSFLRRALGTQSTPSNQILVGLSLFLTFFLMAPVWQEIQDTALGPYLSDEIQPEIRVKEVQGRSVEETITPFQIALERAIVPIRRFMWLQLGTGGAKDVALFLNMANLGQPATEEDVPTRVLLPAFVISELKKAFIMGFILFVPFLIIDMVTSAILMSMGMMMLPPVMISLPFKLLLFVLVDGWNLVVRAIGLSFIPS
ncbi:MAG TPA: flagellar type III secretion system pore protein FliP [bacterium]|nr:flagellar type III secretion system pore protein FliP [bacterium]